MLDAIRASSAAKRLVQGDNPARRVARNQDHIGLGEGDDVRALAGSERRVETDRGCAEAEDRQQVREKIRAAAVRDGDRRGAREPEAR